MFCVLAVCGGQLLHILRGLDRTARHIPLIHAQGRIIYLFIIEALTARRFPPAPHMFRPSLWHPLPSLPPLHPPASPYFPPSLYTCSPLQALNLEEGGAFTTSSADEILAALA